MASRNKTAGRPLKESKGTLMAAKARTQLNEGTDTRRQGLLSRAMGLILELVERSEDASDIAWLKKAGRKPARFRTLEDYLAQSGRH